MLRGLTWRRSIPVLRNLGKEHRFSRMTDGRNFLPTDVRGMTVLDRSVFQRKVQVPKLTVEARKLPGVLSKVKEKVLKFAKLKAVFGEEEKTILLNPDTVKSWEDVEDLLKDSEISEESLQWGEIELNYENFKFNDVFKAVLPEGQENFSSFSQIGHIIHVNLKDHLLPFGALIGQVLLDKIPTCKTVVNKIHTIDSTFRNFQMEILAGQEQYQVEVRENGFVFEFDFSKVYWNPRLSSEHERIVKSLPSGSHLCDVFAGVGPFSVPAGRKKCHVLANDLNPDSVRWLQHNAKRNKVEKSLKITNKDGREFILSDLKDHLVKFWKLGDTKQSLTIVMNLPALAVEFLDAFSGLLADNSELQNIERSLPLLHVYTFVKGGPPEDARTSAETHLGHNISDFVSTTFVRNVSPNKDMFRVTFHLTDDILFCQKSLKRALDAPQEQEPFPKILCTSQNDQ
ncbi:tRNA (guanine(37)-N1)-methyltransferase [Phlebotomus argentipes]|uniref:tRNA (guanine(37)-N1)-methyltransferase n=1 Tax=Phlebotomus argentipes TaxID=94469 RepID=UPI002893820F|nr:tRNA (guanine(37)-N1)-methyltransferase [Phlebotomus argentipes]